MSAVAPLFRLPEDKQPIMQRAQRLEWLTIAALASIIVVVGLVMGSSQAMKTMWVEDLLSLVPPISFLVGVRYRKKRPNSRFPYGYRRAVLVGFLTGAVALFGFGGFMLLDSVLKLVKADHPTIESIQLFGHTIWLGWLMMAALAYSVIPPLILGRKKLPIARELHDKVLQVSAELNKGDWLAGVAGILGILGIALGFWWCDALSGAIISVEIIKDGYGNLRNAVAQLMNKTPSDVDSKNPDAVTEHVQQALEQLPWVAEARVRLREDGDVLTGEAFVVPRDEDDLLAKVEDARAVAHEVDWRLHEVVIVPCRELRHSDETSEQAA